MFQKMSKSIRNKYAAIFIGMVLGTILLCIVMNGLFLEKYYLFQKKKELLQVYSYLNMVEDASIWQQESFQSELNKMTDRYHIEGLVLNSNSAIVMAFGNDEEINKLHLWDNIFLEKETFPERPNSNPEPFQMQVMSDRRMQVENLEMWGTLKQGNFFLFRTPLSSIRDSVRLANRFLIFIGILAAIISGSIIWHLTKRVSKPILELANISQKMADLNFDAKYNGSTGNEIDILGENINHLSQALQETIAELKSANAQLQQDLEKKSQMDDMRREFLSNVSHELKTPIALIQGYAEGLQDNVFEDEESKNFYCNVIMEEASKMNQMVKNLMALNQLEFGENPIKMERLDIVDLIRNYLHSVDILMKQHEIQLRFSQTDPIFVWTDEYNIEVVLANYISNAIHYAGNEKIVDIKFEKRDNVLRVSVFNTGNSIPEDSIDKIWDKFYKVDAARTRAYGGNGIGLSIVKATMENLHQNYGVTNYENGVAFWLEVELA